jgi:hypothetical protein
MVSLGGVSGFPKVQPPEYDPLEIRVAGHGVFCGIISRLSSTVLSGCTGKPQVQGETNPQRAQLSILGQTAHNPERSQLNYWQIACSAKGVPVCIS